MNTLSVNVKYRPIRIGWCIKENNFDDYKKALRLTHTIWGGRFNPLIPVDNLDLAKNLVELFKVDVLFPLSNDNLVLNFIDQYKHLNWPFLFNKELFINWTGKFKEPVFLDIYHAASRIFSDLNRQNNHLKFQFKLIQWDENDTLTNIFEAMFGTILTPDELGVKFDYKKMLTQKFKTKKLK